MEALARVAVMVRAGAAPLWWLGVLAAGIGGFVPGLTGPAIGVYGGAAAAIITAAAVALARRGRYTQRADEALRAPRSVILQDRAVTARAWRTAHRWWLAAAFLVAVAAAFAIPAAPGMVLAGAGAGLWAKAAWIGRLERARDALLWIRTDANSPLAGAYRTTGLAAGDALPGGAKRVPAAKAKTKA
ncbi:hypothetical protein G5C51_27705 [Streptomyces sp. A7024]|uniref:Integral membrane protein n=1 Tax=Streptomyces coryli TaxID=1128680 RepID=A0A6G4U670_9ACTN|nr:hypothetical protein [Streptomyces coryli]NGN67674.1 hypothetical protein [Streptomyces coryli]